MKERTGTPSRDGDTPDPANIPAVSAFLHLDDDPARHRTADDVDAPNTRKYPSFPPEAPIKADDLDEQTAAGFDLVEKIAALHQRISSLHAEMLELIAELHDHPCLEPLPRPLAVSEAAERTGRALEGLTRDDTTEAVLIERLLTGKHTTWELIQTALGLTTRMPRTLQALRDGRLDYRRAVIITKKLQLLGDDHRDAALKTGMSPAAAEQVARESVTTIEDDLFEKVSGHAPAQVHRDVDKAIHRIDPGYAKRHARDNVKGRNVRHRTNSGDATGDIYARLGAPEALAAYNVIDTYARAARQNGAKRSLDELRADAFSHLILHGHLPDGSTPDHLQPVNTENATVVKQESELHPTGPTVGFFGSTEPYSEARSFDPEAQATAPDAGPETTTDADTDAGPGTGTDADTTADANAKADANVNAETDADTESGTYTDDTDTNGAADTETDTGLGTGTSTTDPPRTSRTHTRTRSPGGSGLRAHVQVTVAIETLMGLNEDPADLMGHGPIDADTARDLAFNAGSTWRRLVTDPLSGQLLDYGRKTYRPPVGLADFVKARDVTCRTPSCTRPADDDLDHIISWPAGSTSERNLEAKCDHHHVLKHQGRWKHQLSTDPDHPQGTIVLISPTGHVYLSYPYTYPQPVTRTTTKGASRPDNCAPSTTPEQALSTQQNVAPPQTGGHSRPDADDPPPF